MDYLVKMQNNKLLCFFSPSLSRNCNQRRVLRAHRNGSVALERRISIEIVQTSTILQLIKLLNTHSLRVKKKPPQQQQHTNRIYNIQIKWSFWPIECWIHFEELMFCNDLNMCFAFLFISRCDSARFELFLIISNEIVPLRARKWDFVVSDQIHIFRGWFFHQNFYPLFIHVSIWAKWANIN